MPSYFQIKRSEDVIQKRLLQDFLTFALKISKDRKYRKIKASKHFTFDCETSEVDAIHDETKDCSVDKTVEDNASKYFFKM